MADDSPGKVQALRAIFADKNKPVMGLIPPGGKMSARPWKQLDSSTGDQEKLIREQKVPSQAVTKVLPVPKERSAVTLNGKLNKDIANEISVRLALKPVIGPKPAALLPPSRTNSSTNLNSEVPNTKANETRGRIFSEGESMLKSQARSRTFGETIASFMFTSELNNKENSITAATSMSNPQPPIPKPRNLQLQRNLQAQNELMNLRNLQNKVLSKSDLDTTCCDIINSDNYVCKSKCKFRRREMPSAEKLGPPPLKPTRPPYLKLNFKRAPSLNDNCSSEPPVTQSSSSNLLQKPPKPSYPCPPRPHTPPPLPPVPSSVKPTNGSLRQEIEELYEDTLSEEKRRPVSLIPEYTEEEERAEELYNDAGEVDEDSSNSGSVGGITSSNSHPTEYLQPNIHGSNEEIYQDAEEPNQEEYYEEMPCETMQEEPETPLYSNNRKEIEKLRKEEEKKMRKEQKEKEKREKEMEKIKKKFGLTGDEVPIDDGLVKADNRGGKGDLPVKKGETVLILRMEGNPSGRWLAKNEKGKIGYVELKNIEVDPQSVKSVMSIRRLSVITTSEELYSEAMTEEEAIYEVTY